MPILILYVPGSIFCIRCCNIARDTPTAARRCEESYGVVDLKAVLEKMSKSVFFGGGAIL